MRILILGASGFIGEQIASKLLRAGHAVIVAIRKKSTPPLPGVDSIYCDLNKDITPNVWLPRLKNIDVVINCVGILQQTKNQSIDAIHVLAPKALYEACVEANVKKVIHISALGVEKNINTPYMRTKKAAEDILQSLNLDWIILRPSFVYGQGAYSGGALFRALAALPFCIPVIAGGQQRLQPILVDDLATAVLRLLENGSLSRKVLIAAGAEQVSFTQILVLFRQWLRVGKAKIISLPLWWMKIIAKIGDCLRITSINSATLRMLMVDNVATKEELQTFSQAIGFTPRQFSEVMKTTPSYVQDRWHARLYFLRPMLRMGIGLLWVLLGLLIFLHIVVGTTMANMLTWAVAIGSAMLGVATLLNWRLILIGILQIVTLIIYTAIFTIKMPVLWLLPHAPLFKNILIIIATLVMLAIASDR